LGLDCWSPGVQVHRVLWRSKVPIGTRYDRRLAIIR
jgi:hypothetical protein